MKIRPILILLLVGILISTVLSCTHIATPKDEVLLVQSQKPEIILLPNTESTHQDEVVVMLVVKAGSLQEEDDQLGYAHFVEHMAFRGTELYPREALSHRMRQLGINLGTHSNAYTSFDHTTYFIELNTADPERIEAAIELLSQWAYHIEFDPMAVEEERAVILQEWSLYEKESHRVEKRIFDELFSGSRYGQRMPIGTKESIEQVQAEDLIQFYRQWYHPENMTVVVTGDIDEHQVRQWIDQYITAPVVHEKELRLPTSYTIAPTAIQHRLALTDEFVSIGYVELFWIYDHNIITTQEALIHSYSLDALLDTLTDRLEEQLVSTQGRIVTFDYNYTEINPGITIVSLYAIVAEDAFFEAVQLIAGKLQHILDTGLNEQELHNWRRRTLNSVRNYQDRARDLAETAKEHALYGKPLLTTAQLSLLMEQHLPQFSSESILSYTKDLFSGQPHVWVVHPYALPAPTSEEMDSWIDEIVYEVITSSLQEELFDWNLRGDYEGSIVSERFLDNEVVEFVLSNGMHIYVHSHSGNPDMVNFSLVGSGGFNVVEEPQVFSARLLSETLIESPLRGISGPRLSQWKTAEGITLDFAIDFYSKSFYGESHKDDFATTMKLLHVQLREAQVQEDVWHHVKQQNLNYLRQIATHPHLPWVEAINDVLFLNDPALRMMSIQELENSSLADLNSFYDTHIAGAQNYHMAIVGDISVDEARKIIVESLATLPPSTGTIQGRQFPSGTQQFVTHVQGSKEQYTLVNLIYQREIESEFDALKIQVAMQYLDDVLFDEIRTKAGLVYYIDGEIESPWVYDDITQLTITLATAPNQFEEAIHLVHQTLEELVQEIPTESQVAIWRNTAIQDIRQQLRNPAFVASQIAFSHMHGSLAEDAVIAPSTEISPQDIQRLLSYYINSDAHRIELVWLP